MNEHQIIVLCMVVLLLVNIRQIFLLDKFERDGSESTVVAWIITLVLIIVGMTVNIWAFATLL